VGNTCTDTVSTGIRSAIFVGAMAFFTPPVVAQVIHPTLLAANDPGALAGADVQTQINGAETLRNREIGWSTDRKFVAGIFSSKQKKNGPVAPSRADEWVYLLKGWIRFTSTDGQVTEAKSGDAVFLPKGWEGRFDSADYYEEFYVFYDPHLLYPQKKANP
jgi:uncharacterized cupin superfamily protein